MPLFAFPVPCYQRALYTVFGLAIIIVIAALAGSGCAVGIDDEVVDLGPDAALAGTMDEGAATALDELGWNPYPCLPFLSVVEPRHYLGNYDRPFFFWPDKPDVKLGVEEGHCVATIYSSGDPNLVYFQGRLSWMNMSPIEVSFYVTPGTGVAGVELRFVHTGIGVFPYGGGQWQTSLTVLRQQVP